MYRAQLCYDVREGHTTSTNVVFMFVEWRFWLEVKVEIIIGKEGQ